MRGLSRLTESGDLGKMSSVEKAVRGILTAVRRQGDRALFAYARKFDGARLSTRTMRVTAAERASADRLVSLSFKRALRTAYQRILAYHQAQDLRQLAYFSRRLGAGLRVLPLERVGIYVPGGQVPLVSTVLMNAIPAQVAGVAHIAMVTPAREGHQVDPHVLVAARMVGVTEVYKVGGAQAVAALAYGTASIPKVDKIVGPGNAYVTMAKRLLYGVVGIDKLAGPSEVVILADGTARAAWVAADLLAQAEHDVAARSILVTSSHSLAASVQKALRAQLAKLPRRTTIQKALRSQGGIFLVPSLAAGIDLVNRLAPEHLAILTRSPKSLLKKIKYAGAIFLGGHSPQALGDYLAGPNHVLPTGGSARFSSPLTVFDFIQFQSVVALSSRVLRPLIAPAALLAETEGLTAHARALTLRSS